MDVIWSMLSHLNISGALLWTAVIGAGGVIAVTILKSVTKDIYDWFKTKVRPAKSSSPSLPSGPATQEPPLLSASALQDNPGTTDTVSEALNSLQSILQNLKEREPIQAVDCISPSEIASTVTQAPPAQREAVGTSFVGIRVHWIGYLASVRSVEDKPGMVLLVVTGKDGKSPYAICTVVTEEFPEMKVAPEGAKIAVVGTISAVYSDATAVLSDVKLQFERISSAVSLSAKADSTESSCGISS